MPRVKGRWLPYVEESDVCSTFEVIAVDLARCLLE
jgi:hypothetical protein